MLNPILLRRSQPWNKSGYAKDKEDPVLNGGSVSQKGKAIKKQLIIIPNGFEPNYTLGFVKGLAANGMHPLVVSCDGDHARLRAAGIRCTNLRGSQEQVRSAAEKARNLLSYYARLLLLLVRNRGSMVHFTGLFRKEIIFFEGMLLSLTFKLMASPYIYTVHNVLPHGRENSIFFRWAYMLLYRMPDILVVHTSLAKQQLMQQFFVPNKKIVVISIGLNEEVPNTDVTREEARRRLGFALADRIVLFFGKADEYKGLRTLIKAFDQSDACNRKLLVSAWFPSASYRQDVLSLIGGAKRKNDISLREGFLPNEYVELFFKSADVLALPYKNIYQSGLVFLSFDFGLPIVATNVGSFKEFIEEDMGVIAENNDARGISNALDRFFQCQDRFRPEAIARKAQKYRWDRICETLLPLYATNGKRSGR
jgi:glycosyltransferase involved in cell wall biosynthesis